MNDYSSAFQPDMSQFMQAPQAPQASGYPALPNAYGLGQVEQQQPAPAPIDPFAQQKQKNQQMIGNYSTGAGPWDIGDGPSGAR